MSSVFSARSQINFICWFPMLSLAGFKNTRHSVGSGPSRVRKGSPFQLLDFDPHDWIGFENKKEQLRSMSNLLGVLPRGGVVGRNCG